MGALRGFAFFTLLFLVFTLGILSFPILQDALRQDSVLNYPTGASTFAQERLSPGDWTTEKDFALTENGLLYKNKNVIIANFADTNSMDPLLDINTMGIQIVPESIDDVNVGDVIVYTHPKTGDKIIHRAVEEVYRNGEKCFRVAPDNTERIQYDDVLVCKVDRVLVGLFY